MRLARGISLITFSVFVLPNTKFSPPIRAIGRIEVAECDMKIRLLAAAKFKGFEHMYKQLATVFALCTVTSVAIASDLPSKTSAPSLLSSQKVADWSGFYVGVVAGGGTSTTYISDDNQSIGYPSRSLTEFGGTVGGTVGFNIQNRGFVYGVEGDANLASFKHSHDDGNYGTLWNSNFNSLSTLRGRAGIAVDNALVYVTAGLAFVGYDLKGDYSPTNSCAEFEAGDEWGFCLNGIKIGFVGGAGVEYALSNAYSVKFETLYVAAPTIYVDDVRNENPENYGVNSSMFLVRVGLNYRF